MVSCLVLRSNSQVMGCASSNPLITGGKNLFENAKESANDVLNKGEQTMNEVGGAAKDGIMTGMESVKGAMESAVHTAENSIGGVMTKITDTLTNTKEAAKETVEETSENVNATKDNLMEAVSEAETVLAGEMETGKDAILDKMDEKTDAIKHSFGETIQNSKEPMVDLLEIEDIEQSMQIIDDNMGNDHKQMNNDSATPPIEIPLHSPEAEVKMEEPAPTLWEIAADLIVEKKETAIKLMAIPINEVLLHKDMVSQISPEVIERYEEKLSETVKKKKEEEESLDEDDGDDEILYDESSNIDIIDNQVENSAKNAKVKNKRAVANDEADIDLIEIALETSEVEKSDKQTSKY